MRRFIPLIIFALIGIAFAIGLTRDPRKLDPVLIETPFPQFNLESLDSPQTRLTEKNLKGQISLINVFGSWCISCNVEHPILMDIAARENINLIGINWRDEREKGQDWLSRRGNPYGDIIFDPASILAVKLGVVGAPETFLTDASGTIRYKHIGCLLYTSPSPRDKRQSRMPSSA